MTFSILDVLRFFFVFLLFFVGLSIFFKYTLSPDERAVLLIRQGRNSDSWETLHKKAEAAYFLANDDDVKDIADFWVRYSKGLIAARDPSQRNPDFSVRGITNKVMAGLDPKIGWDSGVRVVADFLLLRDEFNRVEQKYGDLESRPTLPILAISFLAALIFRRKRDSSD